VHILGVSEGPEGGAAVVIDDRLVAVVSQAETGVAAQDVPWEAAARALAIAGLGEADIDLVMVAGRYVPMFLRRRPMLRRLVENPFSVALDASVAMQAVLRHSGVGAFEADVAAEWMHGQFEARGYRPRRTVTVEVHRALAEAAYRLQPVDPAVVLTLHPLGDGVALAVHVGAQGQLDQVDSQKGFESLHTHLRRVLAEVGLAEHQLHRLGVLAAGAAPDARLERLLGERFAADAGRLTRGAWPSRSPAGDPVRARIAELSRGDAAASILENLAQAVEEVARFHLRSAGIDHLCVAGRVFEEPRVVARLAEMPEVARLSVLPRPGASLLALGAAADGAGLAPAWVDLAVGASPSEAEVADVVHRSGLRPLASSAAEVLARGGVVARLRGPAGLGRVAQGARCVLTRADDPGAAVRLRRAMSLPDGEEPTLLLPEDSPELGVAAAGALGTSLRHGVAALALTGAAADRVRSCLAADGRVPVQQLAPEHELSTLVHEVRRMTGCPALLAWPLAEGDAPQATDPRAAVEVWRRSGADALQLGSVTVGRAR